MSNEVLATGSQIYAAAIAGAKRGYNRSTDEYIKYAQLLQKHYEAMLRTVVDKNERNNIIRNTGGNWRNAYLPLSLAMYHNHIGGKPCETHARVYLTTNPAAVFDIPLDDWQEFVEVSEELLA